MCASPSQLLDEAADSGRVVEMENLFSRLTLDIIGKAVFDYDFDSLTHDDPVIQVKYQMPPCRVASGLRAGTCQSCRPGDLNTAAAKRSVGYVLG